MSIKEAIKEEIKKASISHGLDNPGTMMYKREVNGLLNKLYNLIYKEDTIVNCPVQKRLGCNHVDSCLCDVHECFIVKRYLEINVPTKGISE